MQKPPASITNATAPPAYHEIVTDNFIARRNDIVNKKDSQIPLKPEILQGNHQNIPAPPIFDKNTDVSRWLTKIDAFIFGNNVENKTAVMKSYIDDDCLELILTTGQHMTK